MEIFREMYYPIFFLKDVDKDLINADKIIFATILLSRLHCNLQLQLQSFAFIPFIITLDLLHIIKFLHPLLYLELT